MNLPCRYEELGAQTDGPRLDRPDALAAIAAARAAGRLDATQVSKLQHWVEHGWVILFDTEDQPKVDAALVDAVAHDMMELVRTHKHLPFDEWKIQLQNRYAVSEAVRRMIHWQPVLRWIGLILGKRPLPFQTLSMPIGSQIPPHADHVLMTTHPQGYMVAAWFALEAAARDAGPLTLWSGSHRLPYLSAREVGIPHDGSDDECSQVYAQRYYEASRERIARHGLAPFYYLAKKGEVLLWHANLLHGGAPIERADSSRKSLVVHYFGEGVHHYSDLFHRPCDIPAT